MENHLLMISPTFGTNDTASTTFVPKDTPGGYFSSLGDNSLFRDEKVGKIDMVAMSNFDFPKTGKP
ncbi:MAG: hypothetical protein QCI82_08830 [Candidatus Thermoplasmatota archaeon]|nr:hypothetical protein [Candidatus Thermoplasmatota archaeon]